MATLRVFLLLGVSLLGLTSPSLADVIDLKDLPKEVTATVTARYPKGKLTEARKTLEDKVVIYEVDLTNENTLIEIAVFADGKVDWIAVDLPIADIPKPVMMGIRKKYPAATLTDATTIYTVQNGKDQVAHYAVELTTKAGKSRLLDVLPDGTIEEDELAD